jgi:Metallo-beta-lactamase superfamily
VLSIEALPAEDGDCLWIEWTSSDGPHRILVDGGRTGTALMTKLEQVDDPHFDLLICTHIDMDHIGGLLKLFRSPPPALTVDDVWFNGRPQVLSPQPRDTLGIRQGEELTDLLQDRGQAWNAAFGGGPVATAPAGELPVRSLPELSITVLSPGPGQLAKLAVDWAAVLAESPGLPADALGKELGPLEDLVDARYSPDRSTANASSIAVLLEHADGGRVLLGADAKAEVLVGGLSRFQRSGRVRVDLCQLPHHGSKANLSPELLRLLDCRQWLISTSGRGGPRHPDRTALARILARRDKPTLWFNYRGKETEEFANPSLIRAWNFTSELPPRGMPGIAAGVRKGDVSRVM